MVTNFINNDLFILVFSVIAFSLAVKTVQQLKLLKVEVGYMPEPAAIQNVIQEDTLVGKNLLDYVPLDLSDGDEHYAVALTSCTCSYCHSGMEELIAYNQSKLKIFNIMECNDLNIAENKLDFKEDVAALHMVSDDVMSMMGARQFPTFLIVDHTGEILLENTWSKPLLRAMNNN
ncbi:hypothetical protein ACFFJY_17800 [Fictibacillus aquaticus]|uniref:Thioredoxin-like fold domain-containing protein n=1 Tax=Fictibacillus aquaticus TaxID=2021314 RepID=A0A235F666_9BACL|nr:hypothetical protein [Fictibacillus aquaticus]OYD56603.1 hypothetical protein CGZ90_16455 [Fictibacillus aquaticus]